MRAIVISDSHHDSASINMLLTLHKTADMVIFLGDGEQDFFSDINQKLIKNKKIIAVKGNCDFGSTLCDEGMFNIHNKKFYVLHGHTKLVKHGLSNLIQAAEKENADIVLYGHTHSEAVEYNNGIYYMCPGSIKNGSYGIVDIDEKTNTVICYTEKL